MEERAPGGELRLTPREWVCWTPPPHEIGFETRKRAYALPDRPVTRFEYLEMLAFAPREET
jgi:hypothetical protein